MVDESSVESPLVSVDARRVLRDGDDDDDDDDAGEKVDADALGAPDGTPGSPFMFPNTFDLREPPARPGLGYLFWLFFFFFLVYEHIERKRQRTSQVPTAKPKLGEPKRSLTKKGV